MHSGAVVSTVGSQQEDSGYQEMRGISMFFNMGFFWVMQ